MDAPTTTPAATSPAPRQRRRRYRYHMNPVTKGPSMAWLALLGAVVVVPPALIFIILFAKL